MKDHKSIWRMVNMAATFVILAVLMVGTIAAQNIKNNGIMNNTAPLTCTTFTNYKGAKAGTLNNTSTVTVSGASGTTFDNNLSGATVANGDGVTGGTIDLTGGTSDYTNGAGSTTNNTISTIRLAGSITNGAGTITSTLGGFEYYGTAAQTIFAGVVGSTIGNLTITNSSTKTLGGSITVGTLVTVNTGATLALGSGNTLTLHGPAPITLNGTGAVNFTTGATAPTVIYSASGAQAVLGASYINLTLQNGGTKTAGGAITMTGSGTLTNAALTTFDLSTFALNTVASTTISNANTIQTGGSVTLGSVQSIAGTFSYYGTAGQSVGGANYANLSLSGAGGKTMPANFGVSGIYTVAGGTGARTYTGSTMTYNATSAQTVLGGESYNNLTIAAATDTTAANYKTASGAITVGGTLTINAGNTLDMATYSGSTFAAATNNGKIRWAGSNFYVAGTGTTDFYGSSATTIAGGTNYGNIFVMGSGTNTISGSVTATGGTAAIGVTVVSNLTVSGFLTVTGMDLVNKGAITNNGSIIVQ